MILHEPSTVTTTARVGVAVEPYGVRLLRFLARWSAVVTGDFGVFLQSPASNTPRPLPSKSFPIHV